MAVGASASAALIKSIITIMCNLYQVDLKEGSLATAGDVIGYMGHAGYSAQEYVFSDRKLLQKA